MSICDCLSVKSNITLFVIKMIDNVDLEIFAKIYYSRILRMGQIREFQNLLKIIIIIALLKKNEESRNLNFVKSPQIQISRRFQLAKTTRSIAFTRIHTMVCWDHMAIYMASRT